MGGIKLDIVFRVCKHFVLRLLMKQQQKFIGITFQFKSRTVTSKFSFPINRRHNAHNLTS